MQSQLLSSLVGTYYSTLLNAGNTRYTNLFLVSQSILTLLNKNEIVDLIKSEYVDCHVAEFEQILMASGHSMKNFGTYTASLNKTYTYNGEENTILDIILKLNNFLFKLNNIIIEELSSIKTDFTFDLSLYDTKTD